MRKFTVTVELEVEDVTCAEVKEYVEDAVTAWGGQFHPDDPFFGDNKSIMKVKCNLIHAKPVKKRLTPIESNGSWGL